MKDRIKQVRKSVKMTQQEFADSLNMSKSSVEGFEYGRIKLTDRTISDICSKYKVNETWLRTGEGNMFDVTTREQEIGSIAASIIKEDDPIKMQLEKIILSLTKEQVETLYEIAKKVVDAKEDAD